MRMSRDLDLVSTAKRANAERKRPSRRRPTVSAGAPARRDRRARTSTPTKLPLGSRQTRSSSPSVTRNRPTRIVQPCARRCAAATASAPSPSLWLGLDNRHLQREASPGRGTLADEALSADWRAVIAQGCRPRDIGQSGSISSSSNSGRSSNSRPSGSWVPESSSRIGANERRCQAHGPSLTSAS